MTCLRRWRRSRRSRNGQWRRSATTYRAWPRGACIFPPWHKSSAQRRHRVDAQYEYELRAAVRHQRDDIGNASTRLPFLGRVRLGQAWFEISPPCSVCVFSPDPILARRRACAGACGSDALQGVAKDEWANDREACFIARQQQTRHVLSVEPKVGAGRAFVWNGECDNRCCH